MDTAELAKTSKDIVVAKCVSSEVKKDENTGFIYTYTTFKVDESLKGKYDDEIVLRIIGGTVGDTTIKAPDVPTFSPDEEVVLFLGPKNTMGYPVLKSINRGVYRIQSDESGARIITTPVVGLDIVDIPLRYNISGQNIHSAVSTSFVVIGQFLIIFPFNGRLKFLTVDVPMF